MAGLHRPRHRKDFEIALICALRVEFDAVEALFDDYYEDDFTYGKAPGDPNAYTTGKLCGHNVVLAYMPGIGKASSASVAASFSTSFPGIKLGIVVGVCGGVPFGTDDEREILLGDVIISKGLIKFDFGRQYPNRLVRKDTLQENLGRPSAEIRAFLAKLSGRRNRKRLREKTSSYLEELCRKDGFQMSSYPGADKDKLYQPAYWHKHRGLNVCSNCANCRDWADEVCNIAMELPCEEVLCEDSQLIPRVRVEKAKGTGLDGHALTVEELQEAKKPLIHFGLIASGDMVMKSGLHRDQIASCENVIAFEMEGAGVWDNFPTVVIKSVCDYADSHKNKKWQRYAAATSAACMKAFLEEWRTADRSLEMSNIPGKKVTGSYILIYYHIVANLMSLGLLEKLFLTIHFFTLCLRSGSLR
jgi:nucleoside phosphorylase